MTRRKSIKTTLLGTCVAAFSQMPSHADTLTNGSQRPNFVPESSENLDSLKKEVKFAIKWWNFEFVKCNLAVCLQELPYIENCLQNVYVWRQKLRKGDNS